MLFLWQFIMRLFSGTQWDQPPRCDRCEKLVEECQCAPEPPPLLPPETQTAKLSVEKRKAGKLVTVIRNLPSEGNDLPSLLTELKSACASGGTVKEAVIELQGKHLQRVREVLGKLGYKTQG